MELITEILKYCPWVGIPLAVIYVLFQIWKEYKAEKRTEKAIELFINDEKITFLKTDEFTLKRKE